MNLEGEWAAMEARTAEGEGLLVRRVHPEGIQDIYLGLEKVRRTRLMLLEVDADAIPEDFRPFRAKGIRLRQHETQIGRRSLLLELVLPQFSEIFTNLVADVIQRVAKQESQRAAVTQLIQRLQQWKVLLSQDNVRTLSQEQQMGIFGELFFLRYSACPVYGTTVAATAWEGPFGADKDFRLPNVSVEIKTQYINGQPHEIRVANEHQLSSLPGKPLLLFFIAFSPEAGEAGETLGEAISAIRKILQVKPEALAAFEERLAAAGYFDVHSDIYTTRYTVESQRVFRVAEGFPRLTPENLPLGVHHTTYTVTLDACGAFELIGEEISRILMHRAEETT